MTDSDREYLKNHRRLYGHKYPPRDRRRAAASGYDFDEMEMLGSGWSMFEPETASETFHYQDESLADEWPDK